VTWEPRRWVGTDDHFGIQSLTRPDVEPPPGWSLEAIAAVERPHHPRVSPDGRFVAFTLDRDGSDIWVVPVAGGAPIQVTVARDPSPYWEDDAANWSPDGSRLAYTADGWVWTVAVEGGIPERLVKGSGPSWLDDGRVLMTVEREGEGRLVTVDTRDPWPVPLTPAGHDPGSAVSRGELVAYVRYPADDRKRSEIWIADGEGTRALTGTPGIRDRSPAISPDRSLVAFTSEESGWNEIQLVGTDGSKPRRLTNHQADFSGLDFSDDGRMLVAATMRRGHGALVIVSVEQGEVTPLAEGGEWSDPGWAGQSVVAVHEDYRTPARLVRVDRDGEMATVSPPPPAAIGAAHHRGFEEITYESFDGLEIHGFLFRPDLADGTAAPAVVYPHGGPTSAYNDSWDGHAQYFVAKGYGWLAINYRGSTGYGIEFEQADHGVWGVADTEDCLAAADYLAGLDWVDESRVGIFGASYGSYLALASLARDPRCRFACGVAKYGDSNIATSWALTDRGGREDLERMMGRPSQDREAYREASPLWNAADIERPILIAHGEQDFRVHPNESAQLVEELKRLGKTFEYVTYPSEAHGLLRTGPQVDFYRRLERFLDWHLM